MWHIAYAVVRIFQVEKVAMHVAVQAQVLSSQLAIPYTVSVYIVRKVAIVYYLRSYVRVFAETLSIAAR